MDLPRDVIDRVKPSQEGFLFYEVKKLVNGPADVVV